MKLCPREIESLLVHQAGYVAQKRLARGLRLNYPEVMALISHQVSIQILQWGFKSHDIYHVLTVPMTTR